MELINNLLTLITFFVSVTLLVLWMYRKALEDFNQILNKELS